MHGPKPKPKLDTEGEVKMKKHVVLFSKNGQQTGVVMEEESVCKAIKQMRSDISRDDGRKFIDLLDYVAKKDPNQTMCIRKSTIAVIGVMEVSNIVQPGKNIVFPGRPGA